MADLSIVAGGGGQVAVPAGEVERLGASLGGGLLRPGEAGFDEARAVWNGLIDRKPALVARCRGVADVIEAVRFARARGLLVAVRGGGHNVAGSAVCEGGLLIDLSPMRGVRVDAAARRAHVEGGALWADVDREAQAFGLATPGGVVSDTGVAGLTLGGGIGWLRRKHGMSCDNLASVEIVTAEGRVVRASADENADLFWGVRGGGGNFGVVTSFEFRLHPVGPEVMFGVTFYPAERGREILRAYREYTAGAPDEVSSFAICGTVPDEHAYPAEARGRRYVLLAACYAGPVERGEAALKPLRELGGPLCDFSGPMPYVKVQTFLDADYPRGRQYYWKSLYLNGLADEAIDRLLEHAGRSPSPLSTVDVWHLGGAMARVGADETAFGRRDAPYLLGVEANWDGPSGADEYIAWTRECLRALEPFSEQRAYLNFPGFLEGGETFVRSAFGDNYDRLVALKTKYDPTNLFRLNHNVPPAATPG